MPLNISEVPFIDSSLSLVPTSVHCPEKYSPDILFSSAYLYRIGSNGKFLSLYLGKFLETINLFHYRCMVFLLRKNYPMIF